MSLLFFLCSFNNRAVKILTCMSILYKYFLAFPFLLSSISTVYIYCTPLLPSASSFCRAAHPVRSFRLFSVLLVIFPSTLYLLISVFLPFCFFLINITILSCFILPVLFPSSDSMAYVLFLPYSMFNCSCTLFLPHAAPKILLIYVLCSCVFSSDTLGFCPLSYDFAPIFSCFYYFVGDFPFPIFYFVSYSFLAPLVSLLHVLLWGPSIF
jgi:hypothetical protein